MKAKRKTTSKLLDYILKILAGKDNNGSMAGDIEEEYRLRLGENSTFILHFWLLSQIIKPIPSMFKNLITRRSTMFINYLKITFRNFKRFKTYSFINIAGLAIGLASCIFILLYIKFELSYDNYHPDSDRIYRVTRIRRANTNPNPTVFNSNNTINIIKENFPQVEKAGIFAPAGPSVPVSYNNQAFYEAKIFYAAPDLFEIFSIPFVTGNYTSTLDRPYTGVMSESMAIKYFGDDDPVGKVIKIDTTDFEITGVFKDFPKNSHFKADLLGSWMTIEDIQARFPDVAWMYGRGFAYIKLREGVNVDEFAGQIEDLSQYDEQADPNNKNLNYLQPLVDIHLHSHLPLEAEPPGNLMYLYIFGAVGGLILLIACINFMNLSTARSTKRSSEIGVRKVVGALRRQLANQFLGESVLMAMIAFIIAFVLVLTGVPYFNNLAGTAYDYSMILKTDFLIVLFGLVLITGIISGLYPAMLLSGFKPVNALKSGSTTKFQGGALRKGLVIGQFTISITLIIATLIVYKQLNYMKDANLGFDKEQTLVIQFPDGAMDRLGNIDTIKQEFSRYSSVIGATASTNIMTTWMIRWNIWASGERDIKSHLVNVLMVDFDFMDEFDLELVSGRTFREEMGTDNSGVVYIFNETAAREFGWDSETAIGKKLLDRNVRVIGVMKDFHFQGLQDEIAPLGLALSNSEFRYLSLKINIQNLDETVSFVEDKYNELFPGLPLTYFFLDTEFDLLYRSEEQMSRLFTIFTFLGLLIACLGLFGLASYITEQRTKEIGIRKVIGSSVGGIVVLLTNEFIKWVGIGTLVSWPIAYYAMNYWLQNFAYRIDIGWLAFIAASLSALIIAALTVSINTYRAASRNPVDSLRYE
ncbi:MAG: FtsX-like permease family protein [bacterium]|nr:FtsX-like permease family protein [bacterium]